MDLHLAGCKTACSPSKCMMEGPCHESGVGTSLQTTSTPEVQAAFPAGAAEAWRWQVSNYATFQRSPASKDSSGRPYVRRGKS